MTAVVAVGMLWGAWVGLGMALFGPRRPVRHLTTGPAPARRLRPSSPWLRWVGLGGLTVFLFAVLPPLALAVPVALRTVPLWRARRAAQATISALRAELPDVVDLFVLAVGSGLTVPLAVETVAHHAEGVVADGLRAATARAALGVRLADALDELPDRVGEGTRPLVSVLAASERYGVPLLPALERLAVEVRDERRRHAETVARRLPVKLLFPLVLCILPAFALLTVVPLLAGSLRELRL